VRKIAASAVTAIFAAATPRRHWRCRLPAQVSNRCKKAEARLRVAFSASDFYGAPGASRLPSIKASGEAPCVSRGGESFRHQSCSRFP